MRQRQRDRHRDIQTERGGERDGEKHIYIREDTEIQGATEREVKRRRETGRDGERRREAERKRGEREAERESERERTDINYCDLNWTDIHRHSLQLMLPMSQVLVASFEEPAMARHHSSSC